MRKRNKGSRGFRAVSSRTGRGNSARRSTSGKNATVVEEAPGMTNSRPTNTRGRRAQRNQGSSNGIETAFQSNGKSLLGTAAVSNLNQSDSKTISSDFYLHKKFKKLTTTTSKSVNLSSVNDNNNKSSSSSDVASKDFNSDKQLPTSRLNDSTTLASSVSSSCKDSSLSTVITSNAKSLTTANVVNSVSLQQQHCASNSNQSRHNHVSTSSSFSSSPMKFQSSSFEPCESNATTISSSNNSCNTSAVNTSTTSDHGSASNNTVVYKPKFRIATDDFPQVVSSVAVVSTPASSNNSGPLVHPSSASEEEKVSTMSTPGRINGEFQMDRQSLDDRISKIIDENQSILSTWPEHLTKRLKSHVQRHQQNQQLQQQQQISNTTSKRSTTMLVMGGGAMEIPVELNFIPAPGGSSVKMRNLEMPPAMPAPILIRSQSDAGGHYITEAMTRSQSYNFVPVDSSSCSSSSSSSNNNCGGSFQSINGLSNNHHNNNTNTVVPKKRRKLSPTPVRLCGGEVSECSDLRSSHDASSSLIKGNKGYFQDVDIKIKGGTSGAKVTIRTNTSSSSSGSNLSNYNRLTEVPSSPVSINCPPNHLFMRAGSNHLSTATTATNFYDRSLPEKDVLTLNSTISPNDTNKASTANNPKPRGRPPKEKGIAIVEPLKIESSLLPHSLGPDFSSSNPKLSVIVSPPNGIQKSMLETPLKTVATPSPLITTPLLLNKVESPSPSVSDEGLKTEVGDIKVVSLNRITEEDGELSPKPLVLQSSAPNHKRPTFLALKPINALPKKSEHGVLTSILPNQLQSPETPRGAKPYNQMHINGHAYTYLGFKVSTKSSYTTIFKPQPMFLVLPESDPKLSMYSNWQPRPRHKNQEEIGISTNDSRVNSRKSPCTFMYTSAGKEKCGTQTVNSPDNDVPLWSLLDASYPSPTTPNSAAPLVISNYPFTMLEQPESSAGLKSVTLSTVTTTSTTISSPSSSSRPLASPSAATNGPIILSGGQSKDFSEQGNVTGKSKSTRKSSSKMEIINVTNSSSDCSSADESSNSFSNKFSRERTGHSVSSYHDDEVSVRKNRSQNDEELMLSNSNDDEVSSSGVISQFDSSANRLRIMEGGFESNEDYTYVRGRGRGRYVCEACGIRAKKPSMLRKHLKTHTDLRPYTCKLCNFSFKTKGNLTKHQKSKSHHKKCLHYGIHPNSSRSLEMIGPRFCTSETNTTDDSEDDEVDDGVYNGDSDSNPSQEDMDTEELSSSTEHAESEQLVSAAASKGKTHSFEQEIAQSLLDLSKFSRTPIENGESITKIAKTLSAERYSSNEASLVQINSKPNGFSTNNFVHEDSSCSSQHLATMSNNNTNSVVVAVVEGPMDLSCRNKPMTMLPVGIVDCETDTKRMRLEKNARSFGIVGEAQRWEPEEQYMITGCLNLKKIPNDGTASNHNNSNSGSKNNNGDNMAQQQTINGNQNNHNQVTVAVAGQPTPTTPIADIKPEIRPFNFSNNNIGEKPYEFIVPKRRRDSSTSSCGESYAVATAAQVQLLKLSPIRSSSTLNLSAATVPPPPSSSISSSAHNQNQLKQQKLHQPWLSPRDSRGPDESIKQPPQQANIDLPIKSPLLNNGAFIVREAKNKIGDSSLVVTEGSGEPSVLSSVLIDHQRSVQTSNSNVKPFVNLAIVKPQAEFRQPSGAQALVKDEGKAECTVCNKSFARASQLTLHMNIHYLERPFRCNPCGVSFRSKGHLIKHRRSSSHDSKVKVTYYVANEENPRPFKCSECKIAFRIHGHLAKHLRSKLHIMRMENLGKLPFGTYYEMEKAGLNLNEIDTTDCDVSLISLQGVAKKIYGESWTERLCVPTEEPV